MSKLFTLDWAGVKSALVSTALMSIGAFLYYIIDLKDVFLIDWKVAINVIVISLATGVVSLIQSLLTTDNGNFVGSIKVK